MRALFSRLQFVLSAYRCSTPAVSLLWNVAAYYGIRITETKSGRPNDYATVPRVCLSLLIFACHDLTWKTGSLTTGKGNRSVLVHPSRRLIPGRPTHSFIVPRFHRFVLANTEFLHEKINALSSRVRQLEDALEQSHANLSTEPHPLLTAELRALKRPIEKGHENELLSTLRNDGLGGTNGTSEVDNAEANDLPDAVGFL